MSDEAEGLPQRWLSISQKPNLIIYFLHIERKNMEVVFCFFTDRKQHKAWTWHDYPWPWVSLTWLLYNLQLWCHWHLFQKFTVHFGPVRKELESSMNNNINYNYNTTVQHDLLGHPTNIFTVSQQGNPCLQIIFASLA